ASAGSVAIPLSAVSTAPSVAATSQGASAQQSGGQQKTILDWPSLAFEGADSGVRKDLDGKIVVLRNRKTATPFRNSYLDYPVGAKLLRLVSTISKDPPQLNRIDTDNDTLELKYSNKSTNDRKALLLNGWEGFVTLEESPGVWGVHYDRDDHPSRHVRGNTRSVVEISLKRRILKQPTS
ncbi:hypothetical protein DFH09DRAFT_1165352, partial [Mycena vulgaris]